MSKLLSALELMKVLPTVEAADFNGYHEDHWRELHRQGRVPPALALSEKKFGWRVCVLIAYAETRRVLQEIAVASPPEIPALERRHADLIAALPERDQEFFSAELQDAIRERETSRPP
jgi:hypothetical protein